MEGIPQCNEALTELLNDWDNDAEPFPFEEEMIEEVMQEFYKEIIACPNKPASPTPLSETETEPVVVEAVELPGGDESDEFMGLNKVVEENEMELAAEGNFDDDDDDDDDDAWLAAMLSWSQVVDSIEWF